MVDYIPEDDFLNAYVKVRSEAGVFAEQAYREFQEFLDSRTEEAYDSGHEAGYDMGYEDGCDMG